MAESIPLAKDFEAQMLGLDENLDVFKMKSQADMPVPARVAIEPIPEVMNYPLIGIGETFQVYRQTKEFLKKRRHSEAA